MRAVAVLLASATLVACGDKTTELDDGHAHTHDDEKDCVGADSFSAGLARSTSGGDTVTILSADPAPPDVGDNLWVIEVASGAGLEPTVRPWMPQHGHGTSPATFAGVDHGDGTYTVEGIDLIMPGLWEFTVDLGTEDDPNEAMFAFCIEG